MSDLFENSNNDSPLADRLRPQNLDDIIGQDHIVGKGRLLRRSIAADRLSSIIFYGPPGTGKTSLARVIANTTKAYFESLNAVLSGIKDIRESIDSAKERRSLYGKRTILFVDEVHRWNKAQQDALLPWVENGTVILVGATTENPFFEVNRALVSRSRIFQLLPLTKEELTLAVQKAILDKDRGYGKWNVVFEDGALEHLVEVSSGDTRSLLNALELAVETSPHIWPPKEGEQIKITLEAAEESIQKRAVLYDRDGDYHFDTISAFIKSIRGSDVDAALYWLARMVRAGEDPAFIFRRMIILASEDVGMADPNALSVVLSCASSFERIGFPEGNYPLSHACIYLATAPKSNSTMAFFDALKEVEKEDADIPSHLKDASRDKESFGHGEGYIYPHAYREHWTAQQYLPQTLQGKTFYMPSKIGYEGKICDVVLKRREIQAAIVFSENSLKNNTREEILSWNSPSKDKEEWFKRLESGRSGLLLSDRDAIIKEASPTRSSRILILQGGDGLLLWESLRKAPEGLVACTVENEKEKDALLCFAKTTLLNEDEKPIISVDSLLPSKAEEVFGCGVFDIIIARELWRHASPVFSSFAMDVKQLLSKNGVLVLLNSPPAAGERLSRILQEECPNAPLSIIEKLKLGEESFFKQKTERLWTEEAFTSAFKMAGFKTKITYLTQKEERLILEKDLSVWFASVWGRYMGETIGIETCEQIKALLAERAKRGPILWKWSSMLSRHVL